MRTHTASPFDQQIAQAFEAARAQPRWARGWAMIRPCRPVLFRHGWQVMGLCLVISFLLWLFRPGMSLWGQMVYSVPMGMSTWLLIDGGRFFIDQDSPHLFPRGWRAAALIVSGVFIGFLLGTGLGGLINGHTHFTLIQRAPELFVYIFLFSMASGIGVSLFFYSQGKSAYLHAELEAKSRQATEAQLKLLQSQLDPHMLFNTLANLRVLIQQDPDRAVQMLDQLNDFLRSTLAASRASEHSLRAEFDRLGDYLALMQIRMGQRLSYSMDLPVALAQTQVPSLILQSLVENAIVHGLEPKVQGGHIAIRASQEAKHLVLQVEDDGLGFDATQMQEGFGLTQVRERLQSRYGADAAINVIAHHVDSMPADAQNHSKNTAPGCQICLRLPMTIPVPT